jgi:hypothetical protein
MLPPEAMKCFDILMAAKFLATQDGSGKINVVPIVTMKPYDDKTLIFGNMMMRKSLKNLQEDNRVSACVVTSNLKCYEVTGKFRGFEKTGKYFDEISNIPIIRYTAYGSVRSAGIIDVEAVCAPLKSPMLGLISGLINTPPSQRKKIKKGKLHPCIAEKFERLTAAKVIATRENGRPRIIPALVFKETSSDALAFSCVSSQNMPLLREGDYVASSVLTMDAISYQVKGIFEGFKRSRFGKIGQIRIEEVYSASPPRPGDRIT